MLYVTDEAYIAALVKRITGNPERRPLRTLVNNAGIGGNAPVEVLPLSGRRRVLNCSVTSQ